MPCDAAPVSAQPSLHWHGGKRVAMRQAGVLYFLLADHPSARLRTGLGSTAVTVDATGTKLAELRYAPYGRDEIRRGRGAGQASIPEW